MTTDPSAATTADTSGCDSTEPCSHDDLLKQLQEEVITRKAAKELSEAALAFSEASLKQLEEVKKKTDAAKDAYEKGFPDIQRRLRELLAAVSRERCDCIVSRPEDRALIEKIWTGIKTYRQGLDDCLTTLKIRKIEANCRLEKAAFWATQAEAQVNALLDRLQSSTTELSALAELKKRVEASGGDTAACRYAFCLDLIDRVCELKDDLTTVSDYECELVRVTQCLTRRRDRLNELTGAVREIDSRIELVGSLRTDLAGNWLQRLCASVASGCSPKYPDSLYPDCCGAAIVDDCSRVDPEGSNSDGDDTTTPPPRPDPTPDDPCSKPCAKDTPKPCAEKPSDPCEEGETPKRDPCGPGETPKQDPCGGTTDDAGEGNDAGGKTPLLENTIGTGGATVT